MNFCIGIKKTFLFLAIVMVLLIGANQNFASDYQYKILDPKYNPAAEKLINGAIPSVESVELPAEKNSGFLHFLAILAAISFPIFVLSIAVKSFKKLMNSIPGQNAEITQSIGNIQLSEKENELKIQTKNDALDHIFSRSKKISDTITSEQQEIKALVTEVPKITIQEKVEPQIVSQVRHETLPHNEIVEMTKHVIPTSTKLVEKSAVAVSTPIEKKNPMLLNTAPLTKNKGLCLVEYENKYSLIGYINKQVFFLNQFDSVKSSEIRPRLTERNEGKDRYLVRLGNYKGLIEVSDSEMNLLINL